MFIKLHKVDLNLLKEDLSPGLFNQLTLTLERDNYLIEASTDVMINLQDELSDLLMIKGFDEDYKPNSYGNRIESIIDKVTAILND
ncbi:hypothetical protein GCM10027049_08860 [Mucilaginibacter puniceus]